MNLLQRSTMVSSLALLFAGNLYAQTYTVNTSSLREAIQQISQTSNIPYIVDENILKGKKANPINNVSSLEEALELLFKNTGLEVSIENNIIVIRKANRTSDVLGEIDIIDVSNNISEGNKSYNITSMNTATRLNLSAQDTPQSVSVVTQKKLNDLGLTDIKDSLRTVTGLNVIPNSGKYKFQSRGYTIDQIQEDGVSSTAPGSMFNIYRTSKPMSDLAIFDHIEVVRGATGISQGNGAPGGTVNLVRKKPTKALNAKAEFSIGSWDRYRTVGDISVSLNEKETISARMVAVVDKSKSFKSSVENENKELYGVVDFNLGEDTLLSVGIDYQDKVSTLDYFGLPMGTNGNDLGLSRSTYLQTDWSQEVSTKTNVFAELDHYFNDNWNLEAKFNYRKSNSESKVGGLANGSSAFGGVGSDGLLKVNNLHKYDNDSTVKSFQADATGIYDLFGQSHEVFTGFSVSKEEYNSRWRRVSNSDTYDVHNFNGGQISEPNWDDTSSLFNDSDYKYRFYQNAVNLATRLNFTDELHLLVGTRYSHFKTDGYNFDRKWGGSTNKLYPNTKINKHRFVPYAGLTYDLNDNNTLYGSFTSIYKPQVRKDKNGQLLDPLLGDNYEVGIKSNFFDTLNTSFALFQVNERNRGIYNSVLRSYSPIGKVKSKGFETEISGNINDRLMVSAGYTFNMSKYLETESASVTNGMNFSKHTPKHILKIYSNYRLPIDENRWTVGLGFNAQSKTDSLYNVKQGGYSIWNNSVNYEINKNLNVNLNINNLFDKRYYLNSDTRINGMNNFYGDPRNFMFNLTWKL